MNSTNAAIISSVILIGALSSLAHASPASIGIGLSDCKKDCRMKALSTMVADKRKAKDQDDEDDSEMDDDSDTDQGADVDIGSGKVIGSFRDNSGKVGAGNTYIGPGGTVPCNKAEKGGNKILKDKNQGSKGSGKVTLGEDCEMGTGNTIGGNDNRGSTGSGNVTIGK